MLWCKLKAQKSQLQQCSGRWHSAFPCKGFPAPRCSPGQVLPRWVTVPKVFAAGMAGDSPCVTSPRHPHSPEQAFDILLARGGRQQCSTGRGGRSSASPIPSGPSQCSPLTRFKGLDPSAASAQACGAASGVWGRVSRLEQSIVSGLHVIWKCQPYLFQARIKGFAIAIC